jgi:MFS family permease
MRRNTGLILIAFTLNFVRFGMIFPLIPLLAHHLGSSSALIGLIVGAFSLLSFFLAIPIGGFTDRFGVKRMLYWGVLLNIASAFLLLYPSHVILLMVSQILGGLGFQLQIVASQSFIASLESPYRRERGFGYLTFSAAVGQMIGPVLGGVTASRFNFHDAFFVALLLSVAGLIVLGLRESNQVRHSDPYSLRGDLRRAAAVFSDSRMLAVLAFTFATIFAVSLRTSFLPVLLAKRGMTEADVGLMISLFAASMTVIRPFVGRIFQAFSRKKMMAFSILSVAVGVGLIPILESWPMTAIMICFFGLGFGLTQPLSMVMVADIADPEHPGMSMGVRFMVITLGNLLGPVLLGFLVEAVDLDSSFYASALLVLAVSAYILKWKPGLLPGRRLRRGERSKKKGER